MIPVRLRLLSADALLVIAILAVACTKAEKQTAPAPQPPSATAPTSASTSTPTAPPTPAVSLPLPVLIVTTPSPESKSAPPATPKSWPDRLPDIFSSLWPLVVLVLVIYFTISRASLWRLLSFFRIFKSVKLPGGAEFTLSEEAAKEVTKTAEEAFKSYRDKVNAEYDHLARNHQIWEKLEGVFTEVRPFIRGINPPQPEIQLRCTVQVDDVLFAETLYQLVDYYPRGDPQAGVRGRRWSTRFGIIGRAWRLGQHQAEGEVPTDPDQLIRSWGMTREEALRAGHGRQSFACIVLWDKEGTAVGMLYLDAVTRNAFGASDAIRQQLYTKIVDACGQRGLPDAIAKIVRTLRTTSPSIHTYE